ncbi:MAG: Hcp family type VI secretion system effector [Candidatus Odinarchaeota archaeon]
MKTNRLVGVIIPLALIIAITGAFLTAVMSAQLGNASVDEVNEASQTTIEFTMNLWISGMDGESKIAGRENSIDVLAYSHSIINAYDPTTIARGAASVQHTPLRIVKRIDKATPKLAEACCIASVIPFVLLRFYLEPDSLNYLAINLTSAVVVSTFNYGMTMSDDVPVETISFTYELIKWRYTEFDALGNPKGNVEYEAAWGG